MNFPNASKCAEEALPSFDDLGLAKDIAIGLTQFNNDTYEAMGTCCTPNSVNLVNTCTLWCRLENTTIFDKDIGELSEDDLRTGFTDCLGINLENRSLVVAAVQKGTGELGARPPGLADLGLVLMLVLGLTRAVS
ncbi:hypothetical protein FDECE_1928 [Fusarium decemcellulare]|nr:hypothetical protein FDECE_1928 [Fusarium decemcellulare]